VIAGRRNCSLWGSRHDEVRRRPAQNTLTLTWQGGYAPMLPCCTLGQSKAGEALMPASRLYNL
jgi:hypothetical protein